MSKFQELIEYYMEYYDVGYYTDSKTMDPICTFILKSDVNSYVYEFKLSMIDIISYNEGNTKKTVFDMQSQLSILIRDIKIDDVLGK